MELDDYNEFHHGEKPYHDKLGYAKMDPRKQLNYDNNIHDSP